MPEPRTDEERSDIDQLRRDADALRASGGQQPGTPDPKPSPSGNDASDQRH